MAKYAHRAFRNHSCCRHLALESRRRPPELRSPRPPWCDEIRGRAASGLRAQIELSGRLAGRKWGIGSLAGPFPRASCPPPPPPPLLRPLPRWCERFRLATASLPGCRACPVRGPRRSGFPRDTNPLLRVFLEAGPADRAGGVHGESSSQDRVGPGPDSARRAAGLLSRYSISK